jgi:hypothetical protein
MRSRLAGSGLVLTQSQEVRSGSGFEQFYPGKSQPEIDNDSVILASASSIRQNASLI